MIKNFILNYYKVRLLKLVNANKDLIQHKCLYNENTSIGYNRLKLNAELENLKLQFFKNLPYINKIIKN